MSARILVVDDSPADRELLLEWLSNEDYEVEVAFDGLVAWETLEKRSDAFDVILLDRNMPGLNGLELLERIKRHPGLATVPVILQTALSDRNEILEGIRARAYYYLTKPFDSEMLLSIVGAATEDHCRYKELQEDVRKRVNGLGLMRDAVFTFRTVEEAHDIGGLLATTCPDPTKMVIGLTELLINAVEHGNLGITYDEKTELNASGKWMEEVGRRLALPENKGKSVELRFERTPDAIRFTIRDHGVGFDWQKYMQVDVKRAFDTHGRGIAMANLLSFSRLEYRGAGNEAVGTVNL